MKMFFGLCILVIVLVAISGCTQEAQSATPATALPTPVETTVVTTTEATVIPITTVPLTTQTMVDATDVTTVSTPKPVMTPSTTVTIIYIRNNSFVPQELMVLPGTGITWINADPGVHIVKSTGASTGKFISSELMPNVGRFSYTFGDKEGSYEYMDTITNATGVIIIKKGESFVGNPTVSVTVTATS